MWAVPIVVFFATVSACRTLRRTGTHPLRAWQGEVIQRLDDGSVEVLVESPDRVTVPVSEPPVGTAPAESIAEPETSGE